MMVENVLPAGKLFVLLVFRPPATTKFRMSPATGAPLDQLAAVDQLPLVAEPPVQVRTVAAERWAAAARLKASASQKGATMDGDAAHGRGELAETDLGFIGCGWFY